MVADWSDRDIWDLNRGGHDPAKVFAAYEAACKETTRPTVILAKTIKGYGMGESGEAQNTTHGQKKMSHNALLHFRNKFDLPISDEAVDNLAYMTFPDDSPEQQYMQKKRDDLGGYLPARRQKSESLPIPDLSVFEPVLKGTAKGREISTTMAFVRLLNILLKDKEIGRRIVPIVPDESRTFGMEGLFRQLGIWSHVGQLYTPEDSDQLMFYKEDKHGQVLQEGINEAGGMCDWIAAGTSYSTHNVPMIPFYIFYSMFGFQRVGDLVWAAADQRARGFLLGGTAGRTTLNGEGLQHEDGHSLLWASSVPNCISYDPTFSYELAVIMHDGLKRMFERQEDVFYYLTVMNENYAHPAMPKGVEGGIIKGMYLYEAEQPASTLRVQLLGSGTIFNEVIAAAKLLEDDWGVSAELWSCTSFTELAREGQACERENRLHPKNDKQNSYVSQCLNEHPGPVVIATDYVRLLADSIRPFIRKHCTVLGTDGFGRSDTRENLRRFFEVDRYYVTVAALNALADTEQLDAGIVQQAIEKYDLDTTSPAPWLV